MQSQHGFTLVEVLIVVVILGILAAAVVPNLMGRPDEVRVQTAQSDLVAISQALDMYRLDNFQYPTTEQGLEALVERPTSFPEPKNYPDEAYLDKAPTDPWESPYIYERLSGTEFTLFSLGADGAEGGEGIAADIHFADL